MRTLCTHPGKFGDLLWALPTARAIANSNGLRDCVDFLIPQEMESVRDLLLRQPYIGNVWTAPDWKTQDTAPRTPWEPPKESEYQLLADQVVHLGYREWPKLQLPHQVLGTALQQLPTDRFLQFNLQTPWVEAPEPVQRRPIVVGFTDEYAECKAGLLHALLAWESWRSQVLLLAPPGGSRLSREFAIFPSYECNWVQAANLIAGAEVFVGCLSSLAVLAAALGKPRVLIEPNPHRHHPIFQHWDTELVLGGDGKPTFDARAFVAAVTQKVKEVRDAAAAR